MLTISPDAGDEAAFANSYEISGDLPPGVYFTPAPGTGNGVVKGFVNARQAYLNGAPSVTSGEYSVSVTAWSGLNGTGVKMATVGPITLVAQPGPAPMIWQRPADQTAPPGSSVSFTAQASGTYFHTKYTWFHNGQVVQAPNPSNLSDPLSTFLLTNVTSSDAGDYVVVVSNPNGSVSATARLTVSSSSPLTVPRIDSNPGGVRVYAGGSTTLQVSASGPNLNYQWFKNGVALAGASGSSLTLANVTRADGGDYTVVVSNGAGSVTSGVAHVTIRPTAYFVNLSGRGFVGPGENALIAGFILRGSGAKKVIVRGWGPTLKNFGLTTALADPTMDITSLDGRVIDSNDDWRKTPHPDAVAAAISSAKLYPFSEDSHDAALLTDFSSGGYTALIRPKDGQSTGVGLAELTALTFVDDDPALANLSLRAWVAADEATLIAGAVIGGWGSKRLLVRAVGPTLANFGVSNALADPEIKVVESGSGKVLSSNDDWSVTAQSRGDVLAATAEAGAFSLPDGSKDAALVISAPPGGYTVIASGKNGARGVVLLEFYSLDDNNEKTPIYGLWSPTKALRFALR